MVVHVHNVLTTAFDHVSRKRAFLGACCDIGAQRTVVGERQAKAYCREMGIKYKPRRSAYSFMFGDGLHASLGTVEFRIPTPDGAFIALQVDVVSADVPLLLGIDVLDREQLVTDNVDNVLRSRRYGWEMPIIRRNGHLYVVWNYSQVVYTRSELKKLHLHFFHPSARKLYNLLKRADPSSVSSDTLRLLETISSACRTCTVYSGGPHRFRVSMPKDVVIFNQ